MRRIVLSVFVAVFPAFFAAGVFSFYMHVHAEYKTFANALVLLTVPLVAMSVFFCGYRFLANLRRGERVLAVLELVLSVTSMAVSVLGALRLSLLLFPQ